jgi:Fur family peroxide stress response transcriptional regulator
MKRSSTKPECEQTGEAELRRALERAGWRMTRQRAAVFDYLRSVESHPTADQVFNAVRPQIPKLSLATVYKALEALVDAGLAAKLTDREVHDLPLQYDPRLLEKLGADVVEMLRRQGYHVTGHRLELLGQMETPTLK